MTQEPNNLYDQICSKDIIAPIKAVLMRGLLKMDEYGKISPPTVLLPDRPWLNAAHCPERDCGLWMDWYFQYYRLIPLGCRNCWKVAVRPKTLEELFRIKDLQAEMKLPAKVGIEERGYTGKKGGYAAFWYCPIAGGLQQARGLFSIVEAKLTTLLGKDHGAVLKRGCTEMEKMTIEAGRGGAEDWDKSADQYDQLEAMLDDMFIPSETGRISQIPYPWYMLQHAIRLFIEHAFENDDETYLQFTGGKPLVATLDSFNNSIHANRDYRSTWNPRSDPLNGTVKGGKDATGSMGKADGKLISLN